MTRKQLESCIVFISLFDDLNVSLNFINKKYGLNITSSTDRGEALTLFLEHSKIKLDPE